MTMSNKYYAGIGSRQTPYPILIYMGKIARILGCTLGYTLRSGGCHGADQAFENGCDSVNAKKEIFLPWKGYENRKDFILSSPTENAIKLAEELHPSPEKLKPSFKKLHGRNSHIVLGEHLDSPVSFIICWTTSCGGTQQALRIASKYNIPVFNLYLDEHKKFLDGYIKNLINLEKIFSINL